MSECLQLVAWSFLWDHGGGPTAEGCGRGTWTCEGWNEWPSDFQESVTLTLLRVRKWYPLTLYPLFLPLENGQIILICSHNASTFRKRPSGCLYIMPAARMATPQLEWHRPARPHVAAQHGGTEWSLGGRADRLPRCHPEGGGGAQLRLVFMEL